MKEVSTSVVALEGLIDPVVRSLGLELWGLEFSPVGGSALLRVFIDSPHGVTLDDCQKVSDQVSAVLDVEDPIPQAYRLEVSSPGLNRVLFKPEQYRRFSGKRIKLRLRWPLHGRRNMAGLLMGCSETELQMELDGEQVTIPLEAIHRARVLGSDGDSARQG